MGYFNNYEPKKVVSELDKYIVGQNDAKKVVSIALRNRWRRKQLSPQMQREIYPKNIIMIGPTGVGKTEIARRLSQLTGSPFIKLEATKFTEVGYVGRDVESMIRDLVEIGINIVKNEKVKIVEKKARTLAKKRIIAAILGAGSIDGEENKAREFVKSKWEKGEFNNKEIEVEVKEMKPMPKIEYFSNQGAEEIDFSFSDIFKGMFKSGDKKKRKMKAKDAYEMFLDEEKEKLINRDDVILEAKNRVQNEGIVFIDELDKIAGNYSNSSGPDISREGVQRDLLPLVEGTKVNTRYGVIDTAHILFIGAGAFNVSKPSDLIPELQGRFPLRVELLPLTADDFKRILVEPESSLIKQYIALLGTENLDLKFTKDGINEIATFSYTLNQTRENIGARRLFTVMEYILEDTSFNVPYNNEKLKIDRKFVQAKLATMKQKEDLSDYIL
ncbi:ATP-dependent protease ATPase subunit HslU [bacterium]|nr:ATP-dependent protease ATPase subunit HslU [bacterium]